MFGQPFGLPPYKGLSLLRGFATGSDYPGWDEAFAGRPLRTPAIFGMTPGLFRIPRVTWISGSEPPPAVSTPVTRLGTLSHTPPREHWPRICIAPATGGGPCYFSEDGALTVSLGAWVFGVIARPRARGRTFCVPLSPWDT